MSPELEQQIVSLIQAAKQTGADAASFIAAQAPSTIHQMLAWEVAKHSILIAVFLTFTGFLIWGGRKLAAEESNDPPPFAAYLLAVVFAFATLGSAVCIAKVYVAPNLVVLDQVSSLAKSNH